MKRDLRIKALELAIEAISLQPRSGVTVTNLAERYYQFLLTGDAEEAAQLVPIRVKDQQAS